MIDLSMFCGEDNVYPWMSKPFNKGKYTYATDGFICVRVPCRKRYADTGDGRHQFIDDSLDNTDVKYVEIPSFKLPQLNFVTDDDVASRTLILPNLVMFDALGDSFGISVCYLSWIVNLPEPLISFPEHCGEGNYGKEPVAFSFNGGHGMVMPMLA